MPVLCTDSSLTTITQAAPVLAVGNAVYLTGSKTYALAQANTLASSQVAGFVVANVGPNMWSIQTSGYNIGAITKDYLGAILTPGVPYYLSPTVAGAITSVNPISPNTWSKPLYIPEQIAGIGTVNAGYILNQRPIDFAGIVAYDQAFAMALLFGR
jgi:hypothetical protein